MGEPTRKSKRFEVGEPVLDIALASSGTIFVVTSHGKVVGIDSSGWRAWERRWLVDPCSTPRLTLRVAHDGRPWVAHGGGLTQIDHDGRDRTSIRVARDDGEKLGSFLLAPDGLYVCLYRRKSTRRRLFRTRSTGRLEPRVMKLDPSGSPLWSTTLPVGALGYEGVVEAGVHTGWETEPKRPWLPESWEPVRYDGSEPLLLSGDRLLASFF
jgi:outer membrane protein assembly factor BamB